MHHEEELGSVQNGILDAYLSWGFTMPFYAHVCTFQMVILGFSKVIITLNIHLAHGTLCMNASSLYVTWQPYQLSYYIATF